MPDPLQTSAFTRNPIAHPVIGYGFIGYVLVAICMCQVQPGTTSTPRVIELTADKDSRYRLGGKVSPTIEVSAGEPLILRITAVRAKEVARDGSIHGLALLDKNSAVVPGWRFFFHPGVQEISVAAPSEPGRYSAVCIVICSDGHEGMGFTLVVVDRRKNIKE
jgi:heme/copper-type cytochrome/quinol oxidase subunit 2